MSATRDKRTAKRKLAELGIVSATVLTGSSTITIDLAAFDELVRRHAEDARHVSTLINRAAHAAYQERLDRLGWHGSGYMHRDYTDGFKDGADFITHSTGT